MNDSTRPDVAILVGGQGSRLQSAIGQLPKTLAVVCGKPFIEYLLNQLGVFGFTRIVLCCGYRAEQIKNLLGHEYDGLQLRYSIEDKPLGTAGALRAGVPLVETDAMLVLNGDSFCAVDFERLIRFHNSKESDLTLTLTQLVETARFGTAATDHDGRVSSFDDTGSRHGPGWINAGIYAMQKAWLERLPENKFISLEADILRSGTGIKVFGYKSIESAGQFIDIGTPESYEEADRFFSGIRQSI
jgi:D-glycero-alpha-D-manno-heptose 1-phosphate guanylyltransferase